MYILRDQKIINVDITEDSYQKFTVTAVKSPEELGSKSAIRDVIYTLEGTNEGKYIFRRTQSCYEDNSGFYGLVGTQNSKGRAIMKALEYDYRVYSTNLETGEVTQITK